MDLDELKSTWDQSGGRKKSQSELQWMTRIKNHPKLGRAKIKLIIETILLVAFLSVYHDVLDGGNKPLWLNYTLIGSVLLFISNNIFGYLTLLNPVQGDNIALSLKNLKFKLRRLFILSMVSSFVFGVALMLFLSFNANFTPKRYVLLAGMILTLGIMTYLSYKTWLSRMNQINQSAMEFSENRVGQPS